jgi:plasmid stabilization system protein ParE
VVPELENPTIRELIVRSYRIIYQIRGQQVGVLAVVHGSRELLRQIVKKPWSFE